MKFVYFLKAVYMFRLQSLFSASITSLASGVIYTQYYDFFLYLRQLQVLFLTECSISFMSNSYSVSN